MNRLLAALIWLGLTLPALAQGYLNPPVYATGTIFAVTGVTGSTTTPIKNAYAPNNLNIYNRTAMSGTWHIIMPFPAFDGQIINVGCPGGNIDVVSIETVSGSGDHIGAGGLTECTASDHSLSMYQFQLETNTWRFITTSAGGGGGGCTDCILVESGASSKISAFSGAPQPLGPNGLLTGIWTDPDTSIPANFNFTQTQVLSGQDAATSSNADGTDVIGLSGAGDGTGAGGQYLLGAGTAGNGATGGFFQAKGGGLFGSTAGGDFDGVSGNGSGVNGNGGSASLRGGSGGSTSGSGGGIGLVGGAGNTGGAITEQAGNSNGTGAGGPITIRSGTGTTTGAGGLINIFTQDSPTNPGATGAITNSTGGTANGSSGGISLTTGGASGTGNAVGDITLTTGQLGFVSNNETPGTAGNINLVGGQSAGNSASASFGGGIGGGIHLTGGNGGDFGAPTLGHGTGGSIVLTTGSGVGTGHHSGSITLTISPVAGSAVKGNLIIVGIPVSSAGLPSGAIWANSNVLTIVP